MLRKAWNKEGMREVVDSMSVMLTWERSEEITITIVFDRVIRVQ